MNVPPIITIQPWKLAQAEASKIRLSVFIQEQKVPEHLEWDGMDSEFLHVIARNAQQLAIGTARFNQRGQIGRMAVLPAWRRKGVGKSIMQAIIEHAQTEQFPQLSLNAQLEAIAFYEPFGFIATGPMFEDAGIAHRRMINSL